jgi:hypothetical protein
MAMWSIRPRVEFLYCGVIFPTLLLPWADVLVSLQRPCRMAYLVGCISLTTTPSDSTLSISPIMGSISCLPYARPNAPPLPAAKAVPRRRVATSRDAQPWVMRDLPPFNITQVGNSEVAVDPGCLGVDQLILHGDLFLPFPPKEH